MPVLRMPPAAAERIANDTWAYATTIGAAVDGHFFQPTAVRAAVLRLLRAGYPPHTETAQNRPPASIQYGSAVRPERSIEVGPIDRRLQIRGRMAYPVANQARPPSGLLVRQSARRWVLKLLNSSRWAVRQGPGSIDSASAAKIKASATWRSSASRML